MAGGVRVITVAEARRIAATRLRARTGSWAAEPPNPPCLTIALQPPTERQMLADQAAAEQWAREWAELPTLTGVELEWEYRSWHSIGRQRVPVRLRCLDPDAVAHLARGETATAWRRLSGRARILREQLETSDLLASTIRRNASGLLRLTDEEFAQVCGVVSWLKENPVTGLRPRQLPIRGVDSKWFSTHRTIVEGLHAAATDGGSLGIVDAQAMVRLRILDSSLAIGGLTDLAAPAAALAGLPLRPLLVFVFENLESVLAMPPWPGAVAVHGSGYAVDVVGSLGWVRESPVVYWGDLDSDGFAILNRLRASHPHVVSVLMDEETLLDHRDLWVRETTPNRGTFPGLTTAEQRALARIRDESGVRLEQERIPWETALAALQRVAESLNHG